MGGARADETMPFIMPKLSEIMSDGVVASYLRASFTNVKAKTLDDLYRTIRTELNAMSAGAVPLVFGYQPFSFDDPRPVDRADKVVDFEHNVQKTVSKARFDKQRAQTDDHFDLIERLSSSSSLRQRYSELA